MCRPIVLCVYGMINDTKRWHDKENHPTKRFRSGTSCQRIDTGKHGMYFWPKSIRLYERILWSPMRGYYGLTWEDTMVYWWKIPSAMCRTAGSGSRRFRMSCKTLSHGIFLEISLSIDWFFSVVIDMNTSKAPPWLVRYAHKYTIKSKKVANQKATFSVCIWRQTW